MLYQLSYFRNTQAFSLKRGAKVALIFDTANYFAQFSRHVAKKAFGAQP
ncbi:MAG: hypothetical protein MR693_01905 [Bacteroidales bacterium]|nr:hypothetical protein [Bacteroidales bacterium]